MSPVQLTKYFAYLDKLRLSGKTNMYGAASFVQKQFACGSIEADKATGMWMDTFDDNKKLSERVQEALKPSRDSI